MREVCIDRSRMCWGVDTREQDRPTGRGVSLVWSITEAWPMQDGLSYTGWTSRNVSTYVLQWQSIAAWTDWRQCTWVSCVFQRFTDNPRIISGRPVPTSWLFWLWSIQPMELATSPGLVSGVHCRTIWEIRFSPLTLLNAIKTLLCYLLILTLQRISNFRVFMLYRLIVCCIVSRFGDVRIWKVNVIMCKWSWWCFCCIEQLQDDQTDSGTCTDGQDECMRLLEDTLSLHVDELRAMTDATLRKYIRSWCCGPSSFHQFLSS